MIIYLDCDNIHKALRQNSYILDEIPKKEKNSNFAQPWLYCSKVVRVNNIH